MVSQSPSQLCHKGIQQAAVKDLIEAEITIMKWMQAWKGEMTAMCTYEGNDKNISVGTDVYYEEQASQEEIYLEETEEERRMILESDDPPPPRSESLDQQREHAGEELIIGDSDDPLLGEVMVEQMLSMTLIFQRFRQK
jgi:hypothetical protein